MFSFHAFFRRGAACVLLFCMTAGLVPADSFSGLRLPGFDRTMFDRQFDRAGRAASPAEWLRTARSGVAEAAASWERYAAALFTDAVSFNQAKDTLRQWSEETLQARYAAYLAETFFRTKHGGLPY